MKTNQSPAAPTFLVLFPIYKGSRKFRQIGITQDPVANYKPGVTTRFRNEETKKVFIVTGGGLAEVTEPTLDA